MAIHDPACASQDPRKWRTPEQRKCDCSGVGASPKILPESHVSSLDTRPDLPPIIATVKSGDTLIFLMPELADSTWREIQEIEEILSRKTSVKCCIVPAMGVVHMPAPQQVEVAIDENRMEEIRRHLIGEAKKA